MSTYSSHVTSQPPTWLNRSLYPFTARYFDSADGRMHYVDEGTGTPVVFVHGTPTWSFLYRKLIAQLGSRHRVIAVDNLGFGLSEKPAQAPYEPRDHARRLASLLDFLELSGATFVVHDFGGPIGLSVALAQPERVHQLVLFNTWMWSLEDDPLIARGARLASSWFGRLLYRELNFPVRALMPKAMNDRSVLTPEIHRHYSAPLSTPNERVGTWACARALLGASGWFEELWAERDRLRDKPMLLLWGMKDPTFGSRYLDRWRREFPAAQVCTLDSSGHFVPEEAADVIEPVIARFVADTRMER